MAPLLAHRVATDSDRSFERLYRRHVRDVYGFALGVLGNPADAEDVTQTTFMNAYRSLSGGERVDNPRGWLLAIAQNVCRQRFRTAARRPQEVQLDPETIEAFAPDDTPAADEIRAAMMHLAFNQRTVLVLREIEGRSYAEIAESMGVSVSAVETLLFRARRALREQLEAGDRPLGCEEAEVFISRQLDGRLSRHERGRLRAHLRACPGCAGYARSQRAQGKVLKSMGGFTLPAGLAGALGWSLGGTAAAKAAALVASVAILGTGVALGTGTVPPPWSRADERPAPPAAVIPAPAQPTVADEVEAPAGDGAAALPPGLATLPPGLATLPPGLATLPPGLAALPPGLANEKPGNGPKPKAGKAVGRPVWAGPGQGKKATVDDVPGKAVGAKPAKPVKPPKAGGKENKGKASKKAFPSPLLERKYPKGAGGKHLTPPAFAPVEE